MMLNEPTAPATFQLPEQMSTFAADVDWLYYFLYWLSVVLFVGIVGAMVYWAWKYRERPGHKATPTGHNLPLEISWTVAPIVILVFLFHKGFKGYMDEAVAPAGAMEIHVNAKQWGWEFVYPNGGSDNELHVPVNKPVKLILDSSDVIHSFFVPALRVKRDVVPGMYSSLWFQATHVGTDDIMCAEYCGGRSKDAAGNDLPFAQQTGHWSMHSMIHVETDDDFTKYLMSIGDKCATYTAKGQPCPDDVLAEQGQKIYVKKACVGCHTTNGAKLVGPSWKGIWGKMEATDHGPMKVDENYIRRSILDPSFRIIDGYQPIMPSFRGQISDQEIDEIIAYIKSLKD
jgi:cytochrome c oxidase subunit 2